MQATSPLRVPPRGPHPRRLDPPTRPERLPSPVPPLPMVASQSQVPHLWLRSRRRLPRRPRRTPPHGSGPSRFQPPLRRAPPQPLLLRGRPAHWELHTKPPRRPRQPPEDLGFLLPLWPRTRRPAICGALGEHSRFKGACRFRSSRSTRRQWTRTRGSPTGLRQPARAPLRNPPQAIQGGTGPKSPQSRVPRPPLRDRRLHLVPRPPA